MDGLVFYKLMRILRNILLKSRLNKVTVEDDFVYFSFYKDGVINLEYRAAPSPPVISPCQNISGINPGALSALQGAAVTDIGTFGYERCGFIEVKKRKASGKLSGYKLILEPAGNYANFLLLNDENIILYSLSSRTIDPDRNIGAGGKFSLPKANKRYGLNNFEGAKSFNELAGFYPVTAACADTLLKNHSFGAVCAFIKENLDNDDKFYIDNRGKVIPFYTDNAEPVTWDSLKNYFRVKADTVSESESVRRIKKIFSVKRDKFLSLSEKLQNELAAAEKHDEYRQEAELIKNNLHKVTGSGIYYFEKYNEDGMESVRYEAVRGDNLKEKADKLFKKSARLKKSVPIIKERLQDALQMAVSAEEQIYFADTLSKEDAAEFEKIIKDNKKSGGVKIKKQAAGSFLEYAGDGFRLYIGKNSASNHELVFKFALSDDIWFHVRNTPSAHCILRLENNDLTRQSIETAARAAAYYSKLRFEKTADVDYTYKKYVSKPKNTPPGFVIYKRFKTIAVSPYTEREMDELGLLKR